MAVVRENILVCTQVRDDFFDAVVALDEPISGFRTSDLVRFLHATNIPLRLRGRQQELSIYDIFVFWHVIAMSIPLSVGNAAHAGPIFLPWHRMYLIRFEEMCQEVLNKPDFGLPYWDWAADGELPVQDQWRTDLWTAEFLGEARGSVRSGRIARISCRLVQDSRTGALVLRSTNTLTNLLVFFAVGCVALPRVVMATARHRALPTTKNPAHIRQRSCGTQH